MPPFAENAETTKAKVPWLANRLLSHYVSQGMDQQEADDRSRQFQVRLLRHVSDPETRAEYNRLRTRLPDPWQMRPYMLKAYR